MSVRATALPGAIGQLTISTLLGMALARGFGWPTDAGLLFGLALACGSTVVLTKSLQEHRLLATERGRLAVGWLIVQDLVMVVVLVLLPATIPRKRATVALTRTPAAGFDGGAA